MGQNKKTDEEKKHHQKNKIEYFKVSGRTIAKKKERSGTGFRYKKKKTAIEGTRVEERNTT